MAFHIRQIRVFDLDNGEGGGTRRQNHRGNGEGIGEKKVKILKIVEDSNAGCDKNIRHTGPTE